MKVAFLCLALVASAAAKLPSYFETCSRDDPEFNKCFVKIGNKDLQTLTKGDEKLQIPAVVPLLKHPGAKFEPNDEFYFEIKETDVVGLDTIELLEAKENFKEKSIWFRFNFKIVDWKGTYVAKALKTKEEVSGKSHLIFTKNEYVLNMKFDVKDNRMSIVNITIDNAHKPNIVYHLDNLDKHETINALWEKTKDGFEKVCNDALAEFITVLFGQVCKAATYDEIFPPKH